MSRTADVVIIGGGVIGTATAFYLARAGVPNVVLCEKDFLGSGMTGKSSACIRQHYSNTETARMALKGLRAFERFEELTGGHSAGFVRTGYLLGVPEDLRVKMQNAVELQRAVGISTTMVTPQEMREIEPRLNVEDFAIGCYEPDSGYADPNATVQGLAKAAKALGATILEQTPVTGLERSGDRVTGVRTAAGPIATPRVVNAANVWGDRIAKMMGVEVPLIACRHKISFIQRPPESAKLHPMIYDFVNMIYTRPEPGALTLVGGLDPSEAEDRADPDAYDGGVDLDSTIDALTKLAHRVTGLEDGSVAKGYTGLFDVTPDWHPILDEVPAGSGFYLCLGFSGHGFKLGPAIGEMMTELVTQGCRPGSDLNLFKLERFAQDKPIRGAYGDMLMC
jgi:glycine/D-amino acid oxidase-like deaminating enzyme